MKIVNEVAMVDKNLSVERTPQIIAIEINSIKEQTQKIFLSNSIEIGRRLVEAKAKVEHGEWGKWLENSVKYSQSTANTLMKVYREYGAKQIAPFGDNSNSQALENLSYTQAVLLMGIPQEEREPFIEEHNVENMSTRELQQVIREKQELEQKLLQAEEAKSLAESERDNEKKKAELEHNSWQSVSDSYKILEETNKKHYETAEHLRKELEEAKASGSNEEVERLSESLVKTDNELEASLRKIEELERQIKETPIEVTAAPIIERIPEEVERELQELRKKSQQSAVVLKYNVCFKSLVKGFDDLLGSLAEIVEIDMEAHEKHKSATRKLIEKMLEHL